MNVEYTQGQKQRMNELNCPKESEEKTFSSVWERDQFFKTTEAKLVKKNRSVLEETLNCKQITTFQETENNLKNWLFEIGYTEMFTPMILSKEMLHKMTIEDHHHLHNQVFWLDEKKCLRPMLAPNLYVLMRDIYKALHQPVKIFECGSCFRKESQGAMHLNEFTMLNLVEYAVQKEGEQLDRLTCLAKEAMKACHIDNYKIEITKSEVYGETLDIIVNGVEIASGAYGPHPLDENFGVFETWTGLGIGVERVAMVAGGFSNIKKIGRSTSYVNGCRINL